MELSVISDPTKRLFYQQMSILYHWSVRQLREQEDKMVYERSLIASKPEDEQVKVLTTVTDGDITPDVILKSSYVVDFLGLKRGVLRYLRVTVHSGLLGVMLAVAINTSILRSYTYRLSFTAWIYIGAMLLIVMIAFLAVFFQVRNVAGKDPVRYLREE